MSKSGFYLLPTNKLYKKKDTRQLKNFTAGYVSSFYRNLADSFDQGSDFISRISEDADIPKQDVQKYILATSDFAKSMQTDINHYVTKNWINDASFRQKLDPISKNIIRRQNPLELVFEDISTFDAENPTAGNLLREIDIKKRRSDSDFIRSLPSHPGKDFEIKKRLDKLRGINNNINNNNNNNNNNNIYPSNLFGPGPGGDPPSLPRIDDFFLDDIVNSGRPPAAPTINLKNYLSDFKQPEPPTSLDDFKVNAPFKINKVLPTIWKGMGNNLFGSQTANAVRENDKKQPDPEPETNDLFYELPENVPTLELGDPLLNSLGVEAQSLFDNKALTKKEEEDELLKDFMEQYNIENIKNTMDESGQIPESIFFMVVTAMNL